MEGWCFSGSISRFVPDFGRLKSGGGGGRRTSTTLRERSDLDRSESNATGGQHSCRCWPFVSWASRLVWKAARRELDLNLEPDSVRGGRWERGGCGYLNMTA